MKLIYVFLALGMMSINGNLILAQAKCANNQFTNFQNHIQGLSTQYLDTPGLYRYYHKTSTSTPSYLNNHHNNSVTPVSMMFSESINTDNNLNGIDINASSSTALPDSNVIHGCNTPFNIIEDSTYCIPTGTPNNWLTAIRTSAHENRLSRTSLPTFMSMSGQYQMSVPVNGLFINDNYNLNTHFFYNNGTNSTIQFHYRPVVTAYRDTTVNNLQGNTDANLSMYCAISQPYQFNTCYFDDDGDSISWQVIPMPAYKVNSLHDFSLTNLHFDSLSSLPFLTGYSLTFPFPVTNYQFDNQLGSVFFTPKQLGFFQLALRLSEYRKNTLISYADKIVGFNVRNDVVRQPKIDKVIIDSNASYVNSSNSIYVCAGQTFSFRVSAKKYNPNGIFDSRIVTHGIGSNNIVHNTRYANNDSIVYGFTWTPTNSEGGWHYVDITLFDSLCLPESQYPVVSHTTIPIYVYAQHSGLRSQYEICQGDTVSLNSPSSGYQWYTYSGSQNSLSCPTCPLTLAYPNSTTVYINTPSNLLPGCLVGDSVKVVVHPKLSVNLIGDLKICEYKPFTTVTGYVTPTTNGVNYAWTPSNLCNPTNTATTSLKLLSDTNRFSLRVWDNFGCSDIQDSVVIYMYDLPYDGGIDKNVVCPDDTVQVWASGANTFQWQLSPSGNGVIHCSTCDSTSVAILNDVIISVTITDTVTGCKMNKNFDVNLLERPIADAGPDLIVLDGEFIALDGSHSLNAVNYFWSPTNYLESPMSAHTRVRDLHQDTSFVLQVDNTVCIDKDTMRLFIMPCLKVPIPTVFDPSTGNFKPNNTVTGADVSMKIYNRWGLLVYEEHNDASFLLGWDGKIKNSPQPIETYIYIVDVKCQDLNGNPKNYHLVGNFTLIR